MTANDLSLALGINRNFREGFAREEALGAFLADPDCWMFVAVEEGRIIGFVYGYALQRLNTDRKMLYVHEVGVLEGYQRQGIGSRLMARLKEACQAEHICKIFLTCYRNNAGAHALYRKAGGETCAESQGNDTVYWFHIPETQNGKTS